LSSRARLGRCASGAPRVLMAPKAKSASGKASAAQAEIQRRIAARAGPKASPKASPKPKPAPKASPRAEPKARGKAKAAPTPSPAKRTADGAIKKSRSSQALEQAKAKASRGSSGSGGRRVVDSQVPNRAGLSVVDDYSVKLNQTHLEGGSNNNKFYIIQVLEGDGKYFAWNRWGRVGEPGQSKLQACGGLAQAAQEFEKKFREKTQNPWSQRANFKPVNGKYHIVETEDAEGGGDDHAPMGKLTEAQIGKGQHVLDKLDKELKKSSPTRSQLEVLSSEFYTLIPHNFGRARPPAISTQEMLEAKVELLKFYLRMGFEEVEEDAGRSPVSGVMALPVPASLDAACGGLCAKGQIVQSTKKGEELARRQAGRPSTAMAASLYAAIMLYTSNAIYRDLNQCLRDENRAKLKKYFKYLRLFFESMDHLPKQKRTLWRGLSVDLFDNPQYQVGNVVTWWGISSTTSDMNVAKNFAKGCGGKCTIIRKSLTASDISDITFYSNEKESLLAPGTQLKVMSKKRNGNVAEIKMKEVGRAIG
ncbi:unnamed protein product, partial [Prorocentrum cordatum]